MREIKFRCWDSKEKKYYDEHNDLYLGLNTGAITDLEFPCPEIVLEQYTGLKDSKGVEIFEGDILKDYGKLSWDNQFSGYYFTNGRSLSDETLDFLTLEVIGNIHQGEKI